ncbi:MAG: hypothetical protein ACLSAF_22845 [Intestinimonas sp.]
MAQEAPDLAITGNFWLYETYRPTCPIKADGKVLATDTYTTTRADLGIPGRHSMGIIPPVGLRQGELYCKFRRTLPGQAGDHVRKPDVRGVVAGLGGACGAGRFAFIAFPDGDGTGARGAAGLRAGAWMVRASSLGDGGRKVNYYNRSTGDMVRP